MLFTTVQFCFAFLPVALLGFYLLGMRAPGLAAAWLLLASLFFYAYWMPQYAVLLIVSICINFLVGRAIGLAGEKAPGEAGIRRTQRRWLAAGITFNLALLCYFKYANFLVSNVETLLGVRWNVPAITLPIGISFFTFTQIAFLMDTFARGTREYRAVHYGLFVTYFPHLVAGPVLHHAQMMPQFRDRSIYIPQLHNISAGVTIFALGLAKKVVAADGIAEYADAVFNAAAQGIHPTSLEAWLGAFAYTFQLYFDFSGYSDMAIGLSWMFNVRLPFNFDSPYKALSITDFWRRWHMTLSAFLRDYLYIPLGGNRRGPIRRYVNLALTMLLGGLWHGASWTFVFWGGLHGIYLVVNHAFQGVRERLNPSGSWNLPLMPLAWLLTFLSTVVAWVFFRAPTFASAGNILGSMFRWHGPTDPRAIHPVMWNAGLNATSGLLLCAVLLAVVLGLPNSNRIGERCRVAFQSRDGLASGSAGLGLLLVVFLVVLNASRDTVSAFIYFNF